ncbi:MAG TPA: glycosyltransferase, partial [Microthrixaceae bacterium]|nr:glycosyltransferase [Microthrixaceae bacterium]
SEVVHAHGLKAAWVSLHGRPSRPLVVTVHNIVLDESAGRAARLQRRLERFVLSRADRVIAPSAAIAAGLATTVRSERLATIVPASPIPALARTRREIRDVIGVGDDTPLVTCVARLHPQKDIPTLLHAFAQALEHCGDAHLVVVGDGPDRADVEALVGSLGISESVHLVGFDAHAVDWIGAGDVFALSSVWEAIPLVMAEALQLGVPVVSTAVGMAPELLDDGRAGTVVDVGDIDGLAGGLVRFLTDPAERSRAGSFGREFASNRFDPVALSAEVLGVYEDLVGPLEAVR